MEKGIIFGAGNIGRGFIGQLFSQSGYEVVFVDIDKSLIKSLNRDGEYPISIVSDDNTEEIIVSPVRGVDGSHNAFVEEEIKGAKIIATSVGARALRSVSISIVRGLKKRWEWENYEPINIIICENMLEADKYIKDIMISELNEKEQEYFHKYVGLVEASIGRMVPVVDKSKSDNPLRVYVEAYDQLPVDKDGFKGDIPQIKNMIPHAPFGYYIHAKLFIHNMGHAIAAYLGSLKGYEYIWEAMDDPVIESITIRAMTESANALSKEHGMAYDKIMAHAEDLVNRFKNKALGDTIARVGQDPIRKLSKQDRLGGAATLCSIHAILPLHIAMGIAAALRYENKEDEESLKVQAYIREKGIKDAIKKYTSFSQEDIKHKIVLDLYNRLAAGMDLAHVLEDNYLENKIN